MAGIRVLLRTESSAARLLMSLAGAAALIVGLLAMHVLSTSASHHAVAGSVTISGHAHHPTVSGQASAENHASHLSPWHSSGVEPCDGECGIPAESPTPSMLMAACVLGLIGAILLLLPPASRAQLAAIEVARRMAVDIFRAVAPLRPPSLHVLSISRT